MHATLPTSCTRGYRRGNQGKEEEGEHDRDSRQDDSSHRQRGSVRLSLVDVGHQRLDVGLGLDSVGLGLRTDSTVNKHKVTHGHVSMFSPWTQHTAPQLRPPTLAAKWLLLRDAPGSLHCQPALHPPPIPRGAMLRFAAHLGHQLLLEGREALGHHRHVLAAHKSARASEAAHAEAAAAGRARASSLWARVLTSS